MLRTGRAVKPDHVHRHGFQRRNHGRGVGAQQHPAGHIPKHLRLHRDVFPLELLLGAANAIQRGLDLQDVDAGLDQQHVDAALDQSHRLLAEGVGQLVKRHIGQRRIIRGRQLTGRAHRACHKALAAIFGFILVGHQACQPRRIEVKLMGAVGQTPLFKPHTRGLKCVGFQHIRAGCHVRGMNFTDNVGTGVRQVVTIALGPLATKVLHGQWIQIEARAHSAIIDQHAFGQSGKICGMLGCRWHSESFSTRNATSFGRLSATQRPF